MELMEPYEDGPKNRGNKYKVDELVDGMVVVGAIERQMVNQLHLGNLCIGTCIGRRALESLSSKQEGTDERRYTEASISAKTFSRYFAKESYVAR